jgi:precorrin-2/cobalt-factor-2 C20-methyltransferase
MLDKNEMAEQAVLVSRAGLDDEKIIYDVLAHKKDKLNYLSTILTRKK